MNPRSLTVEVTAGTLDVLAWEPHEDQVATVLALHGFPESAWEWALVADILVQHGIRVVAPLQRGYSAKARPAEVKQYDIEELALDALAVVTHLGLESVHVVGHDWGASVAWWLAGFYPDRVRSLVTVSVPHLSAFADALGSDPDQQERSAYFALFRDEGKAEDVLLDGDAHRLRAMFGSDIPAEQVEKHLGVVGKRAGLTGALNWYRAMRRYDLPDVAVPTTFIWGENDMAIARSGAEATASRMTGDYRFIPLPGGGHWLPEQNPELVAQEILARLM